MSNVALYLSRPKNILKFFGIWITPDQYRVLHWVYRIFILMTQYSFLLFEFIYIAAVWGDLDEVSEASYLIFTQASLCYKVTTFLVNKNNLIELLELMDDEKFQPENKEQERLLFLQSRTIKRMSLFFLTSAITTCTLWAMIPLFDDADHRSFPFKIWMPIGTDRSPDYEIGYISQMVSIYISGFLFIAVDSVALSMIMFGCAQLEIIMDNLKKIKNVPLTAKSKPEVRLKCRDENYKTFVRCIRHHQLLIKFIEKVEDSYHANIFFQLSGTVGIVCIIGLRISIVKPNSVQFLSMVNYMVTMLSQLFLYCWCGNELTIRSENLRDEIYLCPWYEQDTRFRKSMWFAMERMKRPIIFKAGHYIPLSRPTFVSILRSSYSYFAVLNQTKNK